MKTILKHLPPTLALALALLLAAAGAALPAAADAGDLDAVRSYTVTVDPRADGSADITYDINWEVIGGSADEPLSWVKIGLANGDVDEFTNLSPDTVSGVSYLNEGGDFARVVFVRQYYAPGEGSESAVHFAFSVHQSRLYTQNEDGSAAFVFTPGWFNDVCVDELTIRWRADAGMTADTDETDGGYFVWHYADLAHGEQVTARVTVPPAEAAGYDPANAMPAPAEGAPGSGGFVWIAPIFLLMFAVFAALACSGPPRWRGGFGEPDEAGSADGTDAAAWLWYTNGRENIRLARNLPPPAGFTPTAPPAGGGSFRGGGAGRREGGSGEGKSGGHGAGCVCACVSSCACACACAGGGRAGCSAKNFYAVRVDAAKSRKED